MDAITFTVYGRPQQRGSKQAQLIPKRGGGWATRPDGRPIVVARDANQKSKAWMSVVAAMAHGVYSGELLQGPIELEAIFHFKRPKSHFRTGKFADQLRDDAPKYNTSTPDIDKLLRCLSDSLTGVLWHDDRQVCRIIALRIWTIEAECTEVTVRVLE